MARHGIPNVTIGTSKCTYIKYKWNKFLKNIIYN